GFLQLLGPNHGIDVAVAGEFLRTDEMKLINGTRLVSGGFEGKQVGHLMLDIRDGKIASARNSVIEVLQSIPPVAGITKFIDEYKEATKSLPGAETPSSNLKISFAGAQACASCHMEQFTQWKTTKHAFAM